MAGWRQAVALAMTGEEIEALTALSRSRTEPAGRCRGQRCCSAIGRSHRSLPWDEDLACILPRLRRADGDHHHDLSSRDTQRSEGRLLSVPKMRNHTW